MRHYQFVLEITIFIMNKIVVINSKGDYKFGGDCLLVVW